MRQPKDFAAHQHRVVSGESIVSVDSNNLARQFLDSPYGSDEYANWPLDRRLEGFLEHAGLGQFADDGDVFTTICDCVMTHIRCHP
jgi:hypothetical protein